jgi:hypothetical protein
LLCPAVVLTSDVRDDARSLLAKGLTKAAPQNDPPVILKF